jgi:phosphoglycolate phosphatase
MKNLLFDFDGTIADSLNSLITLINTGSEKFNYNKIPTKNDYRQRTMKEFIKYLKIPFYKLPFVIIYLISHLNKSIPLQKPYDKIDSILYKLKKDFHLYLITSNISSSVNKFLINNNLHVFKKIYCDKFQFFKYQQIKKCLKENNIERNNAIFIGDEVRDIKAAGKSKIKCISVNWGFDSENLLKKHNPNYLVSTPKDLYNLIRKLNKQN